LEQCLKRNQYEQNLLVMKNLITIIGIGLILSFSSCFVSDEGPVGPRGPQGVDGLQGDPGEEAYVFEYEAVSFTGPDYTVVLPYADDFVALTSDVTLVYFLWGTDDVNGEIVEVWRPIPQNIITANGMLQYNFDFTIYDVKLFLDAQFPLDDLTAQDTDDWVVRIVVVPGQFWNTGGRMEMPSYDEVKAKFNLKEFESKSIVIERRN
jgi:hypothetical protein